MKQLVARPVRAVLRRLGYEVVRPGADPGPPPIPLDATDWERELVERTRPFTLTSPERVMALRAAVEHVVAAGVPGAFVECGVWRGGSAMVMALELARLGATDRDLFLYDTYTTMPYPGPEDVDVHGVPAADFYDASVAAEGYRYLPVDEVRRVLESTGYPPARLHLVEGLVEDTIPAEAPAEIALCRLDTDWYRSTVHELDHLWPRLAPGGVLLVDDYGHFQGAKQAVDEHFERLGLPVLLHRVDFTARVVVKPQL